MSVSTPSLNSEIRECRVIRDPFFFHYKDLLKENYQNAPFFKKTSKIVDEIYEYKSDYVSEFNINLIKLICSEIGIKTKFKISSKDFDCKCKPAENHLLKILKKAKASDFYGAKRGIENGLYNPTNFKKEKINIYKQEYLHPEYNHNNFLPHLSIIDLLFFNYDNALEVIRKGRNWIKLN